MTGSGVNWKEDPLSLLQEKFSASTEARNSASLPLLVFLIDNKYSNAEVDAALDQLGQIIGLSKELRDSGLSFDVLDRLQKVINKRNSEGDSSENFWFFASRVLNGICSYELRTEPARLVNSIAAIIISTHIKKAVDKTCEAQTKMHVLEDSITPTEEMVYRTANESIVTLINIACDPEQKSKSAALRGIVRLLATEPLRVRGTVTREVIPKLKPFIIGERGRDFQEGQALGDFYDKQSRWQEEDPDTVKSRQLATTIAFLFAAQGRRPYCDLLLKQNIPQLLLLNWAQIPPDEYNGDDGECREGRLKARMCIKLCMQDVTLIKLEDMDTQEGRIEKWKIERARQQNQIAQMRSEGFSKRVIWMYPERECLLLLAALQTGDADFELFSLSEMKTLVEGRVAELFHSQSFFSDCEEALRTLKKRSIEQVDREIDEFENDPDDLLVSEEKRAFRNSIHFLAYYYSIELKEAGRIFMKIQENMQKSGRMKQPQERTLIPTNANQNQSLDTLKTAQRLNPKDKEGIKFDELYSKNFQSISTAKWSLQSVGNSLFQFYGNEEEKTAQIEFREKSSSIVSRGSISSVISAASTSEEAVEWRSGRKPVQYYKPGVNLTHYLTHEGRIDQLLSVQLAQQQTTQQTPTSQKGIRAKISISQSSPLSGGQSSPKKSTLHDIHHLPTKNPIIVQGKQPTSALITEPEKLSRHMQMTVCGEKHKQMLTRLGFIEVIVDRLMDVMDEIEQKGESARRTYLPSRRVITVTNMPIGSDQKALMTQKRSKEETLKLFKKINQYDEDDEVDDEEGEGESVFISQLIRIEALRMMALPMTSLNEHKTLAPFLARAILPRQGVNNNTDNNTEEIPPNEASGDAFVNLIGEQEEEVANCCVILDKLTNLETQSENSPVVYANNVIPSLLALTNHKFINVYALRTLLHLCESEEKLQGPPDETFEEKKKRKVLVGKSALDEITNEEPLSILRPILDVKTHNTQRKDKISGAETERSLENWTERESIRDFTGSILKELNKQQLVQQHDREAKRLCVSIAVLTALHKPHTAVPILIDKQYVNPIIWAAASSPLKEQVPNTEKSISKKTKQPLKRVDVLRRRACKAVCLFVKTVPTKEERSGSQSKDSSDGFKPLDGNEEDYACGELGQLPSQDFGETASLRSEYGVEANLDDMMNAGLVRALMVGLSERDVEVAQPSLESVERVLQIAAESPSGFDQQSDMTTSSLSPSLMKSPALASVTGMFPMKKLRRGEWRSSIDEAGFVRLVLDLDADVIVGDKINTCLMTLEAMERDCPKVKYSVLFMRFLEKLLFAERMRQTLYLRLKLKLQKNSQQKENTDGEENPEETEPKYQFRSRVVTPNCYYDEKIKSEITFSSPKPRGSKQAADSTGSVVATSEQAPVVTMKLRMERLILTLGLKFSTMDAPTKEAFMRRIVRRIYTTQMEQMELESIYRQEFATTETLEQLKQQQQFYHPHILVGPAQLFMQSVIPLCTSADLEMVSKELFLPLALVDKHNTSETASFAACQVTLHGDGCFDGGDCVDYGEDQENKGDEQDKNQYFINRPDCVALLCTPTILRLLPNYIDLQNKEITNAVLWLYSIIIKRITRIPLYSSDISNAQETRKLYTNYNQEHANDVIDIFEQLNMYDEDNDNESIISRYILGTDFIRKLGTVFKSAIAKVKSVDSPSLSPIDTNVLAASVECLNYLALFGAVSACEEGTPNIMGVVLRNQANIQFANVGQLSRILESREKEVKNSRDQQNEDNKLLVISSISSDTPIVITAAKSKSYTASNLTVGKSASIAALCLMKGVSVNILSKKLPVEFVSQVQKTQDQNISEEKQAEINTAIFIRDITNTCLKDITTVWSETAEKSMLALSYALENIYLYLAPMSIIAGDDECIKACIDIMYLINNPSTFPLFSSVRCLFYFTVIGKLQNFLQIASKLQEQQNQPQSIENARRVTRSFKETGAPDKTTQYLTQTDQMSSENADIVNELINSHPIITPIRFPKLQDSEGGSPTVTKSSIQSRDITGSFSPKGTSQIGVSKTTTTQVTPFASLFVRTFPWAKVVELAVCVERSKLLDSVFFFSPWKVQERERLRDILKELKSKNSSDSDLNDVQEKEKVNVIGVQDTDDYEDKEGLRPYDFNYHEDTADINDDNISLNSQGYYSFKHGTIRRQKSLPPDQDGRFTLRSIPDVKDEKGPKDGVFPASSNLLPKSPANLSLSQTLSDYSVRLLAAVIVLHCRAHIAEMLAKGMLHMFSIPEWGLLLRSEAGAADISFIVRQMAGIAPFSLTPSNEGQSPQIGKLIQGSSGDSTRKEPFSPALARTPSKTSQTNLSIQDLATQDFTQSFLGFQVDPNIVQSGYNQTEASDIINQYQGMGMSKYSNVPQFTSQIQSVGKGSSNIDSNTDRQSKPLSVGLTTQSIIQLDGGSNPRTVKQMLRDLVFKSGVINGFGRPGMLLGKKRDDTVETSLFVIGDITNWAKERRVREYKARERRVKQAQIAKEQQAKDDEEKALLDKALKKKDKLGSKTTSSPSQPQTPVDGNTAGDETRSNASLTNQNQKVVIKLDPAATPTPFGAVDYKDTITLEAILEQLEDSGGIEAIQTLTAHNNVLIRQFAKEYLAVLDNPDKAVTVPAIGNKTLPSLAIQKQLLKQRIIEQGGQTLSERDFRSGLATQDTSKVPYSAAKEESVPATIIAYKPLIPNPLCVDISSIQDLSSITGSSFLYPLSQISPDIKSSQRPTKSVQTTNVQKKALKATASVQGIFSDASDDAGSLSNLPRRFAAINGECANTILFDPVIDQGIVRVELIFHNTEYKERIFGIASSEVNFKPQTRPFDKEYCNLCAQFTGGGRVWHKGAQYSVPNTSQIQESSPSQLQQTMTSTSSTSAGPALGSTWQWGDEEIVAAEVNLDSKPRSLRLFVGGKETSISVKNIPQSLRFFAYLNKEGSSFTLLGVRRLATPTPKSVQGSKVITW